MTARLLAAIGTIVVLLAVPTTADFTSRAFADAGCSVQGRVVVHGAWTSIRSPDYPDSSNIRGTTVYSVDPGGTTRILMTNGTSVMLTNDGGCVWHNVFTVPTATRAGLVETPGTETSQLSVQYMKIGLGGNGYLVMAGDQESGDSLAAESSTDGQTWTPSGGLPLNGAVRALAVSPNTVSVAYLLIDHALYETTDGGASWTQTAQFPVEMAHLRVDDIEPNQLWGWSPSTLYHFTSDGKMESEFTPAAGGVAALDVSHVPNLPPRVLVFGENGYVSQSIDGGNTYAVRPAFHATPTSAAHAHTAPDRSLVTTSDGVMWRDADQSWTDVTPDSASAFDDAQVGGGLGFVRTEDGLERRSLFDPGNVDVDEGHVHTNIPPGFLGPPGPPAIAPSNGTVQVTVGHNVTVTYSVFVPHHYKPVDFYFLADTTGSTSSVIAPLQRSIGEIVQGLRLSQIDAHAGLGDFRDYPISPYGDKSDYPYKRRRDLGPLDVALTKALNSLETGGGGDNAEAQLAALYQSATGAGQAVPGTPMYIEPHQQASFRNGVSRVIILGTDAPFHRSDTDPTYPGPSLTATVNALRQRNIKVVGLAMDQAALPGLRELARATGAVAANDVDCNGDGESDIRAGGAVVCSVNTDGADITVPVLNALGAVQDGEKVNVGVAGPGGVVRTFGPASFGTVGLGVDHELPVAVTYGCNANQVNSRFPVTIAATLGTAPLAHTSATVVCLPAGPPEPPPPRPAPLPVKPLPRLHSASPPPPAPVSSANLAPQTSPNMQASVGRQDQQRAQVMMATTDGPAGAGDVELAFSALAAAALASGAIGWTARERKKLGITVRRN